MKYINQFDLMTFLEKPITKLSVFEAETMDALLTMCAQAFPKIEKDFQVTIDFPTFKFQLLKTMGEFLSKCKKCEYECLKHPRERIDQERYDHNAIDIKKWPIHLQKNNAENFFLMDYCLTIADTMFRYLLDALLPREFAHHISEEAMLQCAQWIDENCVTKCKYECIRRFEAPGYCTLCSYMIQPLPCPMKQEIKIAEIGISEEELQCMRHEDFGDNKRS